MQECSIGTTEVVPFPSRTACAFGSLLTPERITLSAYPILPWRALLSRRRVFAGLWRRRRCRPLTGPSCSTPERRDPSERRRVSGGRFFGRGRQDVPAPWDRCPCEFRPWSDFVRPDRICPA